MLSASVRDGQMKRDFFFRKEEEIVRELHPFLFTFHHKIKDLDLHFHTHLHIFYLRLGFYASFAHKHALSRMGHTHFLL